MQKNILSFLITIIASFLYREEGQATNLPLQDKFSIPIYDRFLTQDDASDLPIVISADHAEGDCFGNIIFTGNVDVNYGNSRLIADKVQLYQNQPGILSYKIRTIDAIGNLYYKNNQVIIKGQKGRINLNTKDVDIWKGNYQIVGHQGHGKANLIKQRNKNRFTILEDGYFTSCLSNSNIWSISGSELIHDHKEQIAKIRNARFKLGQIPIFYSPYLKLPVGNKRHSGFLAPNIKYSTLNYFEFYLPYYWNILPNINATVTPCYIHKRNNFIWKNELCYLTRAGTGRIEFDYSPPDKVYTGKHADKYTKNEDRHHWLYHWQHDGILNQMWRFNINYTKVSDRTYFDNFDSKYGSSTDNYSVQTCSAGYSTRNFNATVSTSQFQVFNQELNSNYSAKPQIDIFWHLNNLEPFDLHIYSGVVRFVNSNPNMSESIRFHIEPVINFPWANDWANLNTTIKLMATHYQQKKLNECNGYYSPNSKDSTYRILPQFKIDGQIVLERNVSSIKGYTQTLESRMQYLYVPYRNQKSIHNYDSSFLQPDCISLFRDRTYSGLDLIVSTNQITICTTTRIYDEKSTERFNVSIGEVYYFTESRACNNNIIWKTDRKTGPLIWTGNIYWHIKDKWELRGDLQYDKRLDSIVTGSSTIEYLHGENYSVQLHYRYASPKHIQIMTSDHINSNPYYNGKAISQVSAASSWLIADYWSVIGKCHYNIKENKLINQMIGLQYDSCCYAARLSYEHKPSSRNTKDNQSKYDNIIGFNIELRGLNSDHSLNASQMLRSNISPYRGCF